MKKGQAWGFDLIVAFFLFTGGIVLFYYYSLNYSTEGKQAIEGLSYDGNLIADGLLSEGFPDNWNKTNVTKIGLLNEKKINQTKLERFYNLSVDDYSRTKSLFNTKYNYFLTMSEPIIIDGGEIEGIGQRNLNPKNLVRVTRFTIYQNKPVTLHIEMWE